MKTIILYGPGEVSKRAHLLNIRRSFDKDSITEVDAKQVSFGGIRTLLQSNSLFSEKRLVIIEHLGEDVDLETLIVNDPALTVVIFSGTLLATRTLLKSAAKIKAQILNFEGEKEISAFPFLDALIEKRPQALVELKKLEEEYGQMYVITMIYYLFRRNLLPLPKSDFLQKKIVSQKRIYQNKDFGTLYKLTLETEYKIKSGLIDPSAALGVLVQKIIVASA